MEQIELTAQVRTVTGKQVAKLRREGVVPGILYGHNDEPIALQFDSRELESVVRHAGMSHLLNVNVEGVVHTALVRAFQRDAIHHGLLHVDLYGVNMAEKITVEIPIVLTGESPIVKLGDAMILQEMQSIEVECLPGDLVDAIQVDISGLDAIDDALFVRDLRVPAGIEVLSDADESVVRIARVESGEVEEEAGGAAEVEVIRKAKEEEED